MWLSWNYKDTDFAGPLTFEQKVDLFYQQTLGWQLHIADLIANGGDTFGENETVPKIRHAGFAVLHICFSYFELIGSLSPSTRRLSAEAAFSRGVQNVFPGLVKDSKESQKLLKRLHEGARNGLYHDGRTRSGVGLARPPDGSAINYDPASGTISISPERLPRVLKAHLEQFRRELMDPENVLLRDKFGRRFDAGFSRDRR